MTDGLATIEEIIAEAKAGRMFILVDDEDRENEGDLVIPAQKITPEHINFMARHGRGLICLPLEKQRVEALGLPLMAQNNGSRFSTPFTVSIEAREGVTTGISAADRSHTIHVAINGNMGAADIVTPGHIFPLMARDGGVLVRAGHTEAAVDIARMAGFTPAGVICEILNEDGTMARLPHLKEFAREHGLKIGTIADLIAYRRRTETLVERRWEGAFESVYGGSWQMVLYHDIISQAEHVALVKGDLTAKDTVPVRMHGLEILQDVLGGKQGNRAQELHRAMELIAAEGQGVVVLLRGTQTQNLLAMLSDEEPSTPPQLRDYGIGAQILQDLGVHDMVLLTNHPRAIVGLDGYGLNVVETRPINKEETTECHTKRRIS